MLDDLFAGRGQRPAAAAAFAVAVVMEYILANVAARLTRMALLGITGGTGTPFLRRQLCGARFASRARSSVFKECWSSGPPGPPRR